jgi:hypothetical protein
MIIHYFSLYLAAVIIITTTTTTTTIDAEVTDSAGDSW